MKYYILPLILALCLNVYGEEIDIGRIIAIESSGNPNAYNERSGAIGLMQITPVCLYDYNTYAPKKSLGKDKNGIEIVDGICAKSSLYNPQMNITVGTWYINERIPQMLKAYGIKDTVENRLIVYSWGIGNLRKYLKGEKKLPKSVKFYLRKYKEK